MVCETDVEMSVPCGGSKGSHALAAVGPRTVLLVYLGILHCVPGCGGRRVSFREYQEHVLTKGACAWTVCCSADSGSDSGRCGCKEAGGSQVKEVTQRSQLMCNALATAACASHVQTCSGLALSCC